MFSMACKTHEHSVDGVQSQTAAFEEQIFDSIFYTMQIQTAFPEGFFVMSPNRGRWVALETALSSVDHPGIVLSTLLKLSPESAARSSSASSWITSLGLFAQAQHTLQKRVALRRAVQRVDSSGCIQAGGLL
jgi:hypothetical protein